MLSKFNISTKKLDINELNKEIDKFKTRTLFNPYIFMGADTIEELIKITGCSSDGLEGVLPSGKCGTYTGCKVFCDATKNFGDIELR